MELNVGLNGIDYSYGNLGCEALAYSVINILETESKKVGIKIKYHFFFYKKIDEEIQKISKIFNIDRENISVIVMKLKKINKTIELIKEYKKCDFIIDMSGGDSFSDIYGLKRMIKESIYKNIAIKNKIPIILGPQTYGPYNKKISKSRNNGMRDIHKGRKRNTSGVNIKSDISKHIYALRIGIMV